MKRVLLIVMMPVLFMAALFCGCAGKNPNPIPAYLPGDEKYSCDSLMAEMEQLEADMIAIFPQTDKFLSNAIWAAVFICLMDLKDAEKVEWEAMRVRRNRLLLMAKDKGCDFDGRDPQPIPSLHEIKKMAKEAKRKKNTK